MLGERKCRCRRKKKEQRLVKVDVQALQSI